MVAPDLERGVRSSLSSFPMLLASVVIRNPASCLSITRYACWLNHLYAKMPLRVALIGEPGDKKQAHAIALFLKMPHSVHFPRTFAEFMVFLDKADFYFVEDGGSAQIGAALGKKGVILFGETNPIEWPPLSKKWRFFSSFQALKRIRKSGRDN